MQSEVYDQFATSLDDHWWSTSRRELVRALLQAAGVRPDGTRRVLDVGCGTGTEHAFLAGYGRVTGIEISDDGIRHCRARGYAELLQTDLNDYQPDAGAFDLIAELHVLYHQAVHDPVDVLARLRRGLSPGGLLLISEPASGVPRGLHDDAVMTARRWTRRGLRDDLESAGFGVLKLTGFMATLAPAVIAHRLWERLRGGAHEPTIAELAVPAAWLDSALRSTLRVERAVARWVSLPVGVSWVAIARAT